jgi:hypothetical protein
MTRTILLTLTLLSSPAHAECYCNVILTTNGVCIGSESNVPPPILQCDDQDDGWRWRRQRRAR